MLTLAIQVHQGEPRLRLHSQAGHAMLEQAASSRVCHLQEPRVAFRAGLAVRLLRLAQFARPSTLRESQLRGKLEQSSGKDIVDFCRDIYFRVYLFYCR
jgi:hypothetical protein